MPYRGVIFDLYGTLIDGWTGAEADLRITELGRALGAPLEPFREVMESSYTERATGALGDVDSMLTLLCQRLGHRPTATELARAARLRVAQFREVLRRPRPETPSVLAALRDRGVRVGVITDCSSETPRLWPELGWNAPVEVTLFSWTEGRRKPDPRLYTSALNRLGLAPSECLYVGDGGSQELTGALAVGIEARQVVYSNHAPAEHLRYDPDTGWRGPTIATLTEVLPMVTGNGQV